MHTRDQKDWACLIRPQKPVSCSLCTLCMVPGSGCPLVDLPRRGVHTWEPRPRFHGRNEKKLFSKKQRLTWHAKQTRSTQTLLQKINARTIGKLNNTSVEKLAFLVTSYLTFCAINIDKPKFETIYRSQPLHRSSLHLTQDENKKYCHQSCQSNMIHIYSKY